MNKVIRVAQVINKFDNGGIENIVFNYYSGIDKSKVNFDFYINENSQSNLINELKRMGANVYFCPSYYNIYKYYKYLRKMFKKKNYSIIHSHLGTMSNSALFPAWKSGIAIRICHNHSTASFRDGGKTLLKYILKPFASKYANEYFACGDKAAKWMYKEKHYKKGVYIMYNAIDFDKYKYNLENRRIIRNELGIENDTVLIGHIGRLTKAKNHDFLLKVFKAYNNKNHNSKLVLVGNGELKNKIIKLIDQYNLNENVILTGVRSDVDKIYSALDIFCLPSFYEGMPVVAVESMVNKLPLLCSSCVTNEVLEFSNVKMLTLKTGVDAWANELNRMNRSSVKTEKKEIIERYDINKQAMKLQKFYIEKNE